MLDFLDELAHRLNYPEPHSFRTIASSVKLWAQSTQPNYRSVYRLQRGGPIDVDMQGRRGHLTEIR